MEVLKKVLLLEDDPTVAGGVAILLELEGVEVIQATGVAEATRLLGESEPDALVVDVGLPDGNGIDFYRALRQTGRSFPVVFISGHAEEGLHRHFDSPSVAFLRKPFAFDDLWTALLTVMNG